MASFFTCFIGVNTASAETLIIESGPEGKNSSQYRELTGKWMNSRIPPQVAKSTAPGLTAQGACTTRKTVFSGPNIVTSGPSIARFTPEFKEKGHYHVYVTWPRGANADPVRYVIKYATGETTTKKLTQNGWGAGTTECNAGTWIPLGDYDFDPGQDQYVELHVEPDVKLLEPNWYGQVYADAVCFSDQSLADRGVAMSPQAPPPWPNSEPPTVVAGPPLKWNPELGTAWKDAKAKNKKLLLYFYSKDAYLDHYEKRLFVDPAVQAFIEAGYIPVRLDMNKQRELADKFGIHRAGSVAVYDGAGNPLGLISDPLAPADFLRELQKY